MAHGRFKYITKGPKSCRRHHQAIKCKFGQESLLATTHGKVLEYLGMTIDKTKGNV